MEEPYRLRYFFDPGSGIYLWSGNAQARSAFGYPVCIEELPLSPDTILEARRVTASFDRSLNWDYPPDPGPWDQVQCDGFNAAARARLARLRRELGDGFVIEDGFREVRPG
ncbi:MAG: hypothetical protein M3Q10_04400 [Chloroflexota bacterium]|nr:hypothetical protein [Chloroflexota bacterium]